MGRKSLTTIRNAKTPKHITEIAMTPEQYYKLKLYIKSIVVPGSTGFECERLGNKGSKQIYRQWLNTALEDIGPRFFPRDTKGLVWPEDRDRIYKVVHQAVRVLSIGIRNNYKKKETSAVIMVADDNEMEMAQDGDLSKGKGIDDTNESSPKGDATMPDEEEKYAQLEQEEEKIGGIMTMMDQENQADETMEEEIDAAPIELEDLLSLMKPEVFAQFPNLDDEYFDWDEILDPKSPDPIARLLLLLS